MLPENSMFFLHFLKQELQRRNKENRAYSLRAFSRALGIDPGQLSKILSGKILPSLKLGERFVTTLKLSPKIKKQFLMSLVNASKERFNSRFDKNTQIRSLPEPISLEIFERILDWYHFGILELTYVAGYKHDPRWIALQLGISVIQAQAAMRRLEDYGLILVTPEGAKKKDSDLLAIFPKDSPSRLANYQSYQRQIIEKSLEALEQHDFDERFQETLTLAIDVRHLPLAKKMIHEFTRNLCAVLESGKRTRVYQLNTSLFPLSRGT